MLENPTKKQLKRNREILAKQEKYGAKTIATYFGFAVLLAFAWHGTEIRMGELWANRGNMVTVLGDFFPPDFSQWEYYMKEMVITIYIALWGTFASAVVAVPFGLMSSDNLFSKPVVTATRRLMDVTRSINEVVLAMIFVAAIGLGPFAGVLAIFFHTTGVFAKLYSEAVEAIDMDALEGVRSVGATKIEEIMYGVIPQVMPLWLSFILYRFESNVRSAAVLGIVGAGGIGAVIFETMGGFRFTETCAIMVVIIISVSLVDYLSVYVRNKFI